MAGGAPLFFREEIRITDPFNTIKYMRDVVEYSGQPDLDDPQAAPEGRPIRPRGIKLMGTWYLIGTTGRWPRAINLWQCDGGWGGVWGDLLSIYDGMPESLFWEMSNSYRSGGETVLYRGGPGCPTIDALIEQGTTGEIFLEERLTVAPGRGQELLELADTNYVPVLADYGMQLVGMYESVLRDDAALMLFAATKDQLIALGRAEEAARGNDDEHLADPRLLRWRELARGPVAGTYSRHFLSPCPGSPLSAF